MLNARLYYPIYLIFVFICTLWLSVRYYSYKSDRYVTGTKESFLYSFILAFLVALFIGTRPVSGVFVDMAGTAMMWNYYDEGTFIFSFDRENFLYDNIRAFMSTAGIPVELFFLLMAFIYFFCTYVACRRLFPKDALLAFIVFLGAFSTFSYATNGVKAGCAASIFLLALSYYDKPKISFLLGVISWGMHHSMIMVLCSYVIVYFIRNSKYYFAFWFFSFLIAAAHITIFQEFFGSMADDQGQSYLLGEEGEDLVKMGTGFRIDFILYSALPIFIGAIAVFRKKIWSIKYRMILNLYLMTNSIWLLCIYAHFTNRIAYLSWFLYPFVLIYPFVNEKWSQSQYKTLGLIVCGHLAFTVLMFLI